MIRRLGLLQLYSLLRFRGTSGRILRTWQISTYRRPERPPAPPSRQRPQKPPGASSMCGTWTHFKASARGLLRSEAPGGVPEVAGSRPSGRRIRTGAETAPGLDASEVALDGAAGKRREAISKKALFSRSRLPTRRHTCRPLLQTRPRTT